VKGRQWPFLWRLNGGQTAILLARAYPEAKRGVHSELKFSTGALPDKAALFNARMILNYAPGLADQVLAKQITFEEARVTRRRSP
jgi:hypothetical protein